jgi:hypothetical protein
MLLVELAVAADLFQRGIDRAEHGVQVAAESVDDSNDRKRNSGGDQTVFDRGRAGLVGYEFQKALLQASLPGLCEIIPTPQIYGHGI